MKKVVPGETRIPQNIAGLQQNTPLGAVQKTAVVQRAKGHDGTDRLGGEGASQVNLQLDQGGQPAPIALTVATPELVKQTAAALQKVGVAVTEGELKAAFDGAAKAQAQLGKMAAVEQPARFRIKEDKSRPAVIAGWIDRKAKGPREDPRPRTEFRPKDPSVRPFQIPESAIDGLRSGALVELHLEGQEGGQQTFRVKAPETEYAGSFLANIVEENGTFYAQGVAANPVYAKVKMTDPKAASLVGQQVIVDVGNAASTYRTGTIRDVIGGGDSVASKMLSVAVQEGVAIGFSAQAMAEVEKIRNTPLEGKDLRHIPFITMDNDSSKDLDQAFCIQKRADGGYDVHYAIADAAYFIKDGSALDREAKRRATTTYLPGRSVPMLPKELSDDLVSLLPKVDRRAFVISVSLDKEGKTISSSFERGIIQSREQLTYKGVQKFHDASLKGSMAGKDYTESLDLLRKVGELKMKAAEKRGVIPSDDGIAAALHVVDDKTNQLTIGREDRLDTEKWNEQISLLANEAVAQKMRAAGVQAVFRTQPGPPPEKAAAFREQVAQLGVPWPASQGLQAYLGALDDKDSRTSIIRGLAIRMNQPAGYGTEPLGHDALKTPDYLHFTAPMRRYGDIVNARILAGLAEGTKVPYQAQGDHTLAQVCKLAEDARMRERNIATRSATVLQAAFFSDKIGASFDGRIVGIKPGSLTVELPSGLQVPVSVRAIQNATGQQSSLIAAGTALETGAGTFKLGDKLGVTVVRADVQREVIELAPSSVIKKAA